MNFFLSVTFRYLRCICYVLKFRDKRFSQGAKLKNLYLQGAGRSDAPAWKRFINVVASIQVVVRWTASRKSATEKYLLTWILSAGPSSGPASSSAWATPVRCGETGYKLDASQRTLGTFSAILRKKLRPSFEPTSPLERLP